MSAALVECDLCRAPTPRAHLSIASRDADGAPDLYACRDCSRPVGAEPEGDDPTTPAEALEQARADVDAASARVLLLVRAFTAARDCFAAIRCPDGPVLTQRAEDDARALEQARGAVALAYERLFDADEELLLAERRHERLIAEVEGGPTQAEQDRARVVALADLDSYRAARAGRGE